jgi:hypothetical protein
MEPRHPARLRQIIADGLVIAEVGLAIAARPRDRERAICIAVLGALASLLVIILLLEPAPSRSLPQPPVAPAEARGSGGWAIPHRIVMCESSAHNLPPNEASAAGYYQITSSSWTEGGGSPPDVASRHSRAEQDAVASRLWAAGAGARRWVCK